MGRALALWGIMFFLTIVLVACPTAFSWPYWLYGLIWGTATAVAYYLLKGLLEEEIEV